MKTNPDVLRHRNITPNVGTAQRDHDFHTKVSGLKGVKKTCVYTGGKLLHHLYFISAAAAACAMTSVVLNVSMQSKAEAQTNTEAQTAAASSGQLEEVTVSARKRDERLVDVPASVQVVSADMIDQQRLDNVQDLFGKIPTLYFSSNLLSPGRDYLSLVIRGVGAQSVGVPAVSTYIDGVYTPALGFDIGFLDLERAEVLKGPQGTLFGRNTEGGAVNIVIRRPTQDFESKVQIGYDNFNTSQTKASISGGLTSAIAASIGLDYTHTQGYITDRSLSSQLLPLALGHDVPAVQADDYAKIATRAAARWQPSDRVDVNLTIDSSDWRGHEPFPGIPVPVGGLLGARGETFGQPHQYQIYSDFQLEHHYTNRGIALNADYQSDFGKLTSISGYRALTSVAPFDFDGGTDYANNYHDLRQNQDFASQEVRLESANPGRSLNWTLGLYGFKEHDNQYRSYDLHTIPELTGLMLPYQNQLLTRTGYAVFTEVSWNPVERLELTGGLRFSREEATSNFAIAYTIPNYFGPGMPLHADDLERKSASFKDTSPLASLRYKLADDVSVYARYSKGFKAGGFPQAPLGATTNLAFKSETSNNYELGLKGDFAGRRLSMDLSAFDVEISNQQLSSIVIVNGNLPIAAVANAGKSRSRGLEASLAFRPLDGLSLTANAGYVDARYVRYVDTAGRDRAGERFPFTPRFTGSTSIGYEAPLIGAWKASAGATYSYVGPILSGTGVDIDLQFPVPSYYKVDLRAGFSKNRFSVDLYADNVTDQYIITRIWNTFFFPDPPARPFAIVDPPRRIGARVTYKF